MRRPLSPPGPGGAPPAHRSGAAWMRRGLVAAGGAVLAAAWLGPLPEWAPSSFTAHMTLHMAVVAVAAPLLALGWAGRASDPVRRFPLLFAPVPASLLDMAVVWGWHAPALHHAARSGSGVMALEQGSFLVAGVLVWLSAFGGDPERRPERAPAGVLGLLLASMHMTLLGALLGLAPRALYRDGPALLGLSALEDQHAGGAVMLVVGGAVYLAGGVALGAGLLRHRDARPAGGPTADAVGPPEVAA